jgi:hypothetical protein
MFGPPAAATTRMLSARRHHQGSRQLRAAQILLVAFSQEPVQNRTSGDRERPMESIMTNLSSGNTDQSTNKPSREHPSTMQGDFDNQGCPPIETFRELDFVPRPSTSNSRPSSKANGKGGGKGSGGKGGNGKRIAVSCGNNLRASRKRKSRKKTNQKIILKRIFSKSQ